MACELHCAGSLAKQLEKNPAFDLSELRENIRVMRRISRMERKTRTQKERFTELDLDFHCTIARLSGYGRTFEPFLVGLRGKFRLIAQPSTLSFSEETVTEHQRVVTAIREGDSAKAKKMMKVHLSGSFHRWRSKHPDEMSFGT